MMVTAGMALHGVASGHNEAASSHTSDSAAGVRALWTLRWAESGTLVRHTSFKSSDMKQMGLAIYTSERWETRQLR